MRSIDFTSWESVLATLFGLALVTLIGVGLRLLLMVTVQHRRERMNRQINERLRTLIAAYKVLGGSFTGTLTVDPTHLRDRLRRDQPLPEGQESALILITESARGSDRPRRIRDAVEAALSDIILLGTEEHVQLAATAAGELVAGRPVPTHALVVSLRNFIREALDLDPIAPDLKLPLQGPTRPSSSGGRDKAERGKEEGQKGNGGIGAGGGMGGGGAGVQGQDTAERSRSVDVDAPGPEHQS